ncbi:MAG: hypothetical protein ACRDSH_23665, partial [Pseudonocardiaceae bacterium]
LAWQAAKDVLLTGTGIVLILSQVFSRTPSDILLVTGLALTVPSVAGHARTLLGGGNSGPAERSSSSTPPSGSSSSGSSPEGDDEESR